MEARRRKVAQAHMCRRMESSAKEESCALRCVTDCLMLEFLPTGRSGLGVPDDGVAGRSWSYCWKSLSENFFGR